MRSPASSNSPARSLALTSPSGGGKRERSPGTGEAERRVGPGDGRPEAGADAGLGHGALQLAMPARAVGIRHQRAGQLPDRLGDRIGRQRNRTAGVMTLDRHSRDRAREPPIRDPSRLVNRLDRCRRLSHEQPHEPPPSELGGAGDRGPLERVPLRRLGREHVDVGEDRLGQQIQRRRLQARRLARRRGTTPGHSGPDPIGAEQRIETATDAHLAPPELAVDVRARHRTRGFDLGDQVSQRLLHAGADADAEIPLQRPRVRGHACRPPR